MAPVYVKGGIWTNVEDEILKASISKYGLNQWARVSSLLPKKTAKQCKARWHEWLDPTIKKIEWSNEEDKKLTRMAKLLPNQWRTIAPMIGRTPAQCIERYQHLLDESNDEVGSGNNEFGLQSSGIESLAASGHLVQVGDLHLNPESKPARPDAVDMDDEEKEMLSEARARLASTQGKKAKRKARERMLDESRRIALLQKRREAKNAGINIKLKKKTKDSDKRIDYSSEIPIQQAPLPGLYDTTAEQHKNEKEEKHFKYDVSKQGLQNIEFVKQQKKEKRNRQSLIQVEGQEQLKEESVDFKRRKLKLPTPSADVEALSLPEVSLSDSRSSVLQVQTDSGHESVVDIDDFNESEPETSLLDIDVSARLARLSKASENYEWISEPSAHNEDEESETGLIDEKMPLQDQGDVIQRRALQSENEDKEKQLLRSQAVQKDLPIPEITYEDYQPSSKDAVSTLIEKELFNLVNIDRKRTGSQSGYDSEISEQPNVNIIANVKRLIVEETELSTISLNNYREAIFSETSQLPGLNNSSGPSSDQIQGLVDRLKMSAADSSILEKKILSFNGGYVKRHATLTSRFHDLQKQLLKADLELMTYKEIQSMEQVAIQNRSHSLQDSVEALTGAETVGQKRYGDLMKSI